jgi:transposase
MQKFIQVNILSPITLRNKLTLIGLPPYSPELNPIENLFNEIKQQIKLKSLVNKQFEYIIADTLQNLRSRIR